MNVFLGEKYIAFYILKIYIESVRILYELMIEMAIIYKINYFLPLLLPILLKI